MSVIKCLFSSSNETSMMRLMSFISLIAAIGLAYSGKPGYESFIYAAFIGKGLQKIVEVKK